MYHYNTTERIIKTRKQGWHGRRGTKVSYQYDGAQGSRISYNVFHIKGRCNIGLHPHGQHDSPVKLNENGGTKNQELIAISKKIWQHLSRQKIIITAKYLTGSINVHADRKSWQTRDSSKEKLNSTILRKLCQIMGTPDMYLFASRVSHQLPQCMPWKIDPFSQRKDAFQKSWTHKFVYAFPPFIFIGRVLQKVNQDHCLMLITTPAWPGQPWFPRLLK